MKLVLSPFFKKNKRELIFGSIGVFLLFVMITLFFQTIRFLVTRTNTALEPNVNQEFSQGFDLSNLETLGVIQKEATSTHSTTTTQE